MWGPPPPPCLRNAPLPYGTDVNKWRRPMRFKPTKLNSKPIAVIQISRARLNLFFGLLYRYDDFENDNYQPCRVLGVAVVVSRKGAAAQVTRLIGVSVANHRGLSLEPGVDDKVRRTRVDGAPLGDVPVSYTISGLESYEMPVIGKPSAFLLYSPPS